MTHVIHRLSAAAVAALLLMTAPPAFAMAQPTDVCAGIAGLACSGGQYCHFKMGECRIPDMQGMCKPRPDRCTKEYLPVCGCDEHTYGNRCMAAAAGTSVLHEGACRGASPGPGGPRVCGGIAGIPCEGGEFCQFKTGECRIPDMQGVCKRQPEVCTEEYSPVCGCDGKTWSNACNAAAAGMSVLHRGECRSERPG